MAPTDNTGLVASIYKLEFPLDDEAAKDKVMDHTAERSFDPTALWQLLD